MLILLSLRLRKFIAWLALCAMCFGAAAPTVSKWLIAASPAGEWIEICDAHGMRLVAASDFQTQEQAQPGTQQDTDHNGNPGGGTSSDGDDYCLYCALVHHTPYIPAVAAVFTPHAPPLVVHYAAVDVAAPVLRAWRTPHMPQAPPLA